MTGVKYRLFRAAVTVAVIVVAMAFLMNILTESLIRRSVALSAREQIDDLHRVDQWIARLSIAQSPAEIIAHLADTETSERYAGELAALMRLPVGQISEREETAAAANAYLNFFKDLPFGRKRVLVGRAEGVNIFTRLAAGAQFDQFTSRLANMKSVNLPSDTAGFRAFLDGWPDFQQFLAKVREAEATAVTTIQNGLEGRSLSDALLEAGGSFGDVIRGAGFILQDDEATALAADIERIQNTARIERTINNAGIRKAVAAEKDVLPGDVTISLIWKIVGSKEKAAWFLELMNRNDADTGTLDAETLAGLSSYRANEQLLKRAERQTMETGGGFLGIGKRMTWLALVSMLVCAVGITNAMLMSVTERFREIATLKCLGALDGFIMLVFLIEAGVLGFVGGVGGAIVGFLLGSGRMLLAFKSLMLGSLPLQDLATAGLISIVAGVVLAAAAAVYPSLRAAQLAPMEAMRIE